MNTTTWFVYIILASDAQLYTGITTDIARRWHQHSATKSGAKYFRARAPSAIGLLETAADRSAASRREAALKRLSRPAKIALLLQQHAQTRELLVHTAGELPRLSTADLAQL